GRVRRPRLLPPAPGRGGAAPGRRPAAVGRGPAGERAAVPARRPPRPAARPPGVLEPVMHLSAGGRQVGVMSTARKSYPGDATGDEWAFVAPYLTLVRDDAPQRDALDALRWLVEMGGPWRYLPGDFPP